MGYVRGSDPCISYLQLLHWLFGSKKQQKQPEEAEGDLFAKGQSGNAACPHRRFHEPGYMGCRAVALPISAILIHNLGNLACCPDFKVSHYRKSRIQCIARRATQRGTEPPW
jgi:hypothetical protein